MIDTGSSVIPDGFANILASQTLAHVATIGPEVSLSPPRSGSSGMASVS